MSGVQLILGSASTARSQILDRAGFTFATLVSDVDEDPLTASLDNPTPAELALSLAEAKARSVSEKLAFQFPEKLNPNRPVIVIGADSVFEFAGEAFGKPHVPEVALQRWKAQRGHTGTLHTGQALIEFIAGQPMRTTATTISAQVSFADATDEDLTRYVDTGEPLGCAGGFTLEGRGAALIEAVNGDPNAVLGLSPNVLRRQLAEWNYSLTRAWAE